MNNRTLNIRTFITAALLSSASSIFAQKNGDIRLKTNPLSPMVAAERNINLSVEKIIEGTKQRPLGFQLSAGYIFNWGTFNNISGQQNTADSRGFVCTGELRSYDKSGLFYGPYIQYKTITADVVFKPNSIYNDFTAKKTTTSAGFLFGYGFEMAKNLATEFSLGGGISNKSLYENGVSVSAFSRSNDEISFLLENTGRLPQFVFTYKVIYTIPSIKEGVPK
jgi:hypothetical protein